MRIREEVARHIGGIVRPTRANGGRSRSQDFPVHLGSSAEIFCDGNAGWCTDSVPFTLQSSLRRLGHDVVAVGVSNPVFMIRMGKDSTSFREEGVLWAIEQV